MNTDQYFPWGEHMKTAASLLLTHVGQVETGVAGNKTKKTYSPV